MNALAGQLDDYLRTRRALGFQLGRHGHQLTDFVAYVDAAGADTVTVELAVAWARLGEDRVKPITISHRLSAVRGFAGYLHALDPVHQVPPAGLLAVSRRRPAPYLYSPEEIARLLNLTRLMRSPLAAATHRTLIGLLAACGLRLGEALTLTREDVDLACGLITIRRAKFDRMRIVPTHPTVTAALRDYAKLRTRLCPTPRVDRFFISRTGRALRQDEVHRVFRVITTRIGLRSGNLRPRLHDLRHTFAVRTPIDWQRDGVDVTAMLPVLSTYLGHVEPANTYWYLSAVPELMQLTAARLENRERR